MNQATPFQWSQGRNTTPLSHPLHGRMRGLGGPTRVAQRRALLERAPGVYALFQSATFPFLASAPVLLLNAHRASADLAPEAQVPLLYSPNGAFYNEFRRGLPQTPAFPRMTPRRDTP